jgi:nucleotide-binding universal stress UspA family protein
MTRDQRGDAVPQPAVDRMVPFDGHPVVVGIVPDQDPLVMLTAAALALAARASQLELAYVDTARYVVEEHADGTVEHAALDPDDDGEVWQHLRDTLTDQCRRVLASEEVPWRLHYLAGRPDRSLTHLARAVDASAIVVGTRPPGSTARLREFVEGSVAAHLTHHQHRPVVTVPLSVVDWRALRTTWER